MILYRAVGIDPGLSGALSWIDFPIKGARKPKVGRIYDAPVFDAERRKEFDFHSAVGILQQALQPETDDEIIVKAIVETANPMPGQGVVSTSRYVGTYYAWQAILAALKVAYVTIAPVSWKKKFGLSGDDKEKSRSLALRRFPEAANWMSRKLDHNRAESLLLADILRLMIEEGKVR